MSEYVVRSASTNDAQAVCEIYSHYVVETAVSFELEAPGVEEIQRRMSRATERLPWLVLEIEGRVVGYAYAVQFRARRVSEYG